MPNCPICRHQLQEPPEDVRDWFLYENCGTPLQFPPLFGRLLLCASTLLLAAVIWVLAYVGMRYLGMVFPGLETAQPHGGNDGNRSRVVRLASSPILENKT